MTAHRRIVATPLMLELAQVIGQPAVEKLCEAFGGTRIYVPRIISPAHDISKVLDQREAEALAEHYHGTNLDLPKAYTRLGRAVEAVRRGEMTQREAARASDYSDRHLRRILNEDEDGEQLSLF